MDQSTLVAISILLAYLALAALAIFTVGYFLMLHEVPIKGASGADYVVIDPIALSTILKIIRQNK